MKIKKVYIFLRYFYYKVCIYCFGGWCTYYKEEIYNIKQCKNCTVEIGNHKCNTWYLKDDYFRLRRK